MFQKWYNCFMWIALGAYLIGLLVGMPLIDIMGVEGIIANSIAVIMVTGALISVSLVFIGSFTGHFNRWVNSNKRLRQFGR